MKIYLAGFKTIEKYWKESTEDIYLLSSFYEHKNGKYGEYVKQKRHMLDSGAFTFMRNKSKVVDWDKYVEDYAKFINKNNIKLFIELDIDSVVGLKEVERLRTKLEKLTSKQCIPVWHISRGKEYFLQMIKDYDYVAFGGMLTDGINMSVILKYLNWFIKTAHDNKCKIHGLGFTRSELLVKHHFDSVDSTAWQYGCRGAGLMYWFNGRRFNNQKSKGKYKDYKKLHLHNFEQWVKFQKYAEKYL